MKDDPGVVLFYYIKLVTIQDYWWCIDDYYCGGMNSLTSDIGGDVAVLDIPDRYYSPDPGHCQTNITRMLLLFVDDRDPWWDVSSDGPIWLTDPY